MRTVNVSQIISDGKFNKFFLLVFISCYLMLLFDGYDQGSYGAALPVLIKETGISPTVFGAIASYGMYGMMLGGIVFGMLSDKIGRKKTLLIGTVVYSVFTGLMATANTSFQFAIYRTLAGIGLAGIGPVVIAMVSEYSPSSHRSTLTTIAITGVPIGATLSMLAAMIILPTVGWRALFLVAFIALVFLPLWVVMIPESMEFNVRKNEKDKIRKTLMRANPNYTPSEDDIYQTNNVKKEKASFTLLFKNGLAINTILFWTLFALVMFAFYGSTVWLPKLMMTAGYSLTSSLAFTLIVNLCSLPGAFIFGKFADKFSMKKVLMVSSLLACIFVFLLSFKVNVYLLVLLLILEGMCINATLSMLHAYVTLSYPNLFRGTAIGWSSAIGRLGGAFGPMIGGLLISKQVSLQVIFLTFALPLFISTILLFFTKEDYTESVNMNSSTNSTLLVKDGAI